MKKRFTVQTRDVFTVETEHPDFVGEAGEGFYISFISFIKKLLSCFCGIMQIGRVQPPKKKK